MPSNTTNADGSQVVVVGGTGGVTLVDRSTPLRRLNYFDGKFLRADDFNVEQSYLRRLVALSNQGLGPGVVYGYDTTLGDGDTIRIGPGLAIDPSGNVLLLQSSVTQSIQALIDASKPSVATVPDAGGTAPAGTFADCVQVAAPAPSTAVAVNDIYVIAICTAEALCGQESVYGKLCEEACVTTTDRPYRLDGIVLRALPLPLVTQFPTSKVVTIDGNAFLRSKVAHSWFADEVLRWPSAISRDGLLSKIWCLGAGYTSGYCEVPLAVVARAGATTIFLDAWIVRRERIETPPRRYWQWKMAMRPWDVFLAQVLQFQCQLADVLSGAVTPGGRAADPCANEHQAISDAVGLLEDVRTGFTAMLARPIAGASDTPGAAPSPAPVPPGLSFTKIADLKARFEKILKTAAVAAQVTDRILIRGGIIEMPSAGYLPVVNGTDVSVNDQVRALLGDGLDLRFCVARADYVPHVIEEAQHMERISLIDGLEPAADKPRIDVIVPDGQVVSASTSPSAGLYDAVLTFSTAQTGGGVYQGSAREAVLPSGGSALYGAGAGRGQATVAKLAALLGAAAGNTAALSGLQLTPDLATNAFVRTLPTTVVNFAQRLETAVAAARTMLGGGAATGAVLRGAAAAKATTVDGYWLTAWSDQRIESLVAPSQTPVSGRLVLVQSADTPLGVDVSFNGALTAQSATASGSVVNAALNLLLSVATVKMDPRAQSEAEVIVTERVTGQATFTYTGDDQDGSVTLDLFPTGATDPIARVTRTVSGGVHIAYEILLPDTSGGGSQLASFASLVLDADAGVGDPQNPEHVLAENGLVIVQSALLETDPALRTWAETALFPALPPATTTLTIRAVQDWVAFTRRREEQCSLDVAPPPPVPPRGYRIFNVTAPDARTARELAGSFQRNAADPAALTKRIVDLVAAQQKAGQDFVVTFAGGSAQPLFDPAAADNDWKLLRPGDTIFAAIVGARGDTDGTLQVSRLKVFENAISADSTEDPSAIEIPVVPFPPDAAPPDADGVMLFLTANDVTSEQVFRVDSSESTTAAFNELLKAIPAGDQSVVDALMARAKARQIGTINFNGETTTFAADSGVDAITSQLQGLAVEALAVWSKAGDPKGALRQAQAAAFQGALGNLVPAGVQLVPRESSKADVPAPGPASVLLLVGLRIDRTELLVVANADGPDHFPAANAPRATVGFSGATPQQPDLSNFVAGLPAGQTIRRVGAFAVGALDSLAAALARTKAVFTALQQANRLAPGAQPLPPQPLSQRDVAALKNRNIDLTGIEDVVFLEP